MDIEKWIKENKINDDYEDYDKDGYTIISNDSYILVDDLRELLKTHTIVPRELTPIMNEAALPYHGNIKDVYKAMIEAAEIIDEQY